jgi:hypothetical protein
MSVPAVKAFGAVGIGGFRSGGFWAAIVPSETALFRLCKFIDDISPFELRRAASGGPGGEPEENQEPHSSPWDDPVLWTLMMH